MGVAAGSPPQRGLPPLRVGRGAHRRRIVDATGRPVRLRGVGIGGWMMLENFIDAFPGTEHGLRASAAAELGEGRAEFLFDRLLDHVFAEPDVAWLASIGVNCVRLAVNYRHLEDDAQPGAVREKGYARLAEAVDRCARHGVYAVIDLHAAPGGQNPDWHCDNDAGVPLLWRHRDFQDRLVRIWEELARRFAGNPAVAAYDVLNEPATAAHRPGTPPDWAALNALHLRLVHAIRRVDPSHIIVLEGDAFASRFAGLDAPFADDLVYSTHNYTLPCFGPGRYPGQVRGRHADRGTQHAAHRRLEGTRFCEMHEVPQWAGEMGSVFNGPEDEHPDRLRALDDELDILEDEDIGWSLWTYKDTGVMGLLTVDPQSEYMELLRPVLETKAELGCDTWMAGWVPPPAARRHADHVAALVAAHTGAEDAAGVADAVSRSALGALAGGLLQPLWAQRFAHLSDSRLDEVLAAWSLAQCRPRAELVELVRRRTAGMASVAVADAAVAAEAV